ncbi:putative non-specific serine/threonine protein kinase, Polygalacturonase [Medicago truncatula]|uniref:Putative non-specific serine/threonine protein kinase, Polygalacturonase n=1 Tax=Medicago truncatula TaxID=3880 RepID=A0A396HD44_MEDTR|nr:receptor-like protein EIX2 [Medicago truncatula]RHN51146.1 putative non-specific serine/threonine protein kinase, Polygalacturonase [Medicago truncatula]
MTTMSIMNPFSMKLIQAIFLICLVLQADQFVCSKEVVRCIQSERQALLQFKFGLVDKFGMLSSWTTEDCCEWYGIGCSNITGHVLMLDLHGDYYYYNNNDDNNNYYISGDIHKSLMELQQLQYLNLSRNNFEGNSILGFFGSLRNLRYLDLSYCHFGGQIPIQLESLSHLKYLNLSNNLLDGLIPHQLGGLSNLQFLDLSHNYLEGSIPCQLGNLSNLQFLDLSINYLEGSIPSQLGNLSNLQFLDLHGNFFKGKLPSQLGKLTNLQELYLGNEYGDSGLTIDNRDHNGGQWLSNLTSLTHLLKMVGKLPKLRELSLQNCGLSDHFIHSLSQSKFNFSTSLSILDLSDNHFASSLIFHWVSNISSNLVKLDLSMNLLEDPPSYGYGTVMNSLQEIDLSYNKLKGVAFKSFMNVCTLRSLVLYANNFKEELQTVLHNLSGGCVRNSLQVLDLSSNGITGTLPDLSAFTSLKTLDLSSNQLSGEIPGGSSLPYQLEHLSIASNTLEGVIPKSFWTNACKLKSLDLSYNRFSGTLPDLSIFLFLEMFDISENRLNGKIFEDIRFPTTLWILRMNSNNLSGVISEFHFSGMSMLKELDLSDNSLALTFTENWVPPFQLYNIGLRSCKLGLTFPKWIQTQKYLQDLDISKAGISDNVPEWFWAKLSSQWCNNINISNNNLKGLIPNLQVKNRCSVLSLSSNEFEGPIPPFLKGSTVTDLSKNKFSDSLPFLCKNGIDAVLGQFDLSNNQLSGRIPNCWSNFKSLVYVDLSSNNFSGKIPTSMGSLVELQAFLLRNNNLTGEIPFSLMNCTKLVMLDLRDNRLEGHIPYWIGSELKELQVLSLQRNQFYGSLPLELCHLQKIQLFDLSLNNLSGRIPKCIKNFTSMTQKSSSQGYTHHQYYITRGSSGYGEEYELNAFLTWKGVEQVFNNNELSLLKSIDLSSNHFSDEIPPEIADLIQLVSLNLSRNNFTGKIPSRIGKLISLDFLDLSRNKLLGSIPSSLSRIDRLAVLDLSHNQLSGEIPTSTQLQSFDSSCYEDNLDLCGLPLVKLCVEGKPRHEVKLKIQDDEDLLLNRGFYISLTFGFIIGFWGVFGSILIKRSWRHAYFKFMNNLVDAIYVKCRWWLKD